jgi:hypothetical protein
MAKMDAQMAIYMQEIKSFEPINGKDGIDGKDGLPGRDGIDGVHGKDGKDGINGKSIEIEEIIKLIPEPIKGIDGINGKDGIDGVNGIDGKSISFEEIQKLAQAEITKQMALIKMPVDGLNGTNGKDGQPGRDGLHLEILPGIEESKSYRRGTYAKHLGGLWRSYESTNGLKGWECIVEGIAELSVEQEGERIFKAKATLSSGQVTEKQMYIPAQIYKGVWVAGGYDVGDSVTWGGSQWHCNEATYDKPGEAGSKGWKLCVKRGRDGKDGTNGKDAVGVIKI